MARARRHLVVREQHIVVMLIEVVVVTVLCLTIFH
jgi:hypothetical protein